MTGAVGEKKIYIAGPMSGIKDHNFPAFDVAAEVWRECGWDVFSPAELAGSKGPTSGAPDARLRELFATEMTWIALHADAILMLKGWENSKGAQAEWALARALGLQIFYEDSYAA